MLWLLSFGQQSVMIWISSFYERSVYAAQGIFEVKISDMKLFLDFKARG